MIRKNIQILNFNGIHVVDLHRHLVNIVAVAVPYHFLPESVRFEVYASIVILIANNFLFYINTISNIAHLCTTVTWNDCQNVVSLRTTVFDMRAMNVARDPLGGIKNYRNGRHWSSDFLPKPRSRSAQPMLRWFHVVYSGNDDMINIFLH